MARGDEKPRGLNWDSAIAPPTDVQTSIISVSYGCRERHYQANVAVQLSSHPVVAP